jgi:hypothetical protein
LSLPGHNPVMVAGQQSQLAHDQQLGMSSCRQYGSM